jgi:type II secretory pathway pseudopilin PulG
MRKAYSLIEAVVAVSVLTVIISVGVSIIFVSSDTETTNRDLLIGNSLAAEGAEAMKGVYYTNILKFGEDEVADCGLVKPGLAADSTLCAANLFYNPAPGSDRYYILSRKYTTDGSPNDILTWELSFPDDLERNVSVANDGVLDEDDYRLSIKYICNVSPCNERNNIGEIYAHDGVTPTKFYREILTRDDGGDSVLISSRVHWVTAEGGIRTAENSFELPKN